MQVLLADNQKDVRSALRLTLEYRHPGWQFVEAATLKDVLAELQRNCPDLLLLDWDLRRILAADGLQDNNWQSILAFIHAHCSCLKIVVLSSNLAARSQALQSGADAFVCKADPIETLEESIAFVRQAL
ncbi:MAG: response regulator [Chloroflexota bacterium]